MLLMQEIEEKYITDIRADEKPGYLPGYLYAINQGNIPLKWCILSASH